MDQSVQQWVEDHSGEIESLAHDIFTYAEVADEENQSTRRIADYLKRHGFSLESNSGGLPTAFRAVWGKGSPTVGFLGEYDALPGLDQKPVPYRDGDAGRNGHGCGHNLLGAGSAAAAVALRYAMEAKGIPGTVVYYGCPSEEILKGKIIMANNGCFRELDAALSWHPGIVYGLGETSYLAMDSVHFFFQGKASHAAGSPEMGRSALDAAELMNVGANYLREHVPDDVRIHYAYMDGPGKPNVVPANAGLWYFIRARKRTTVDDVTSRILDIAKGAALMTGTRASWEFKTRGYETLVNHTLCGLYDTVMKQTPLPAYTGDELDFAAKLAKHVDNPAADGSIETVLPPLTGMVSFMAGSTDVSDVSQVAPTGYMKSVCAPKGFPLHSWQFAACSDSGIGWKGMCYAAKVMAQAGLALLEDPALLARVKEEFSRTAKGFVPLTAETTS
ncbi:Amidohydrolase [uncultured delta proteobacterium]|uniref:Amidohydrolase n=1 Tax=uncultured delta proteobacterium TaxID=34034 RepID=A0A212JMJ5_9DELT|nr:Amidohydrolase [uncultured delta proteobacterium]